MSVACIPSEESLAHPCPVLSAAAQHCCFKIKPWGYFCWRTDSGKLHPWLNTGRPALVRSCRHNIGPPWCGTPHLLASLEAHLQGSVILPVSWEFWSRSGDDWDLEEKIRAALWLRITSCWHLSGLACVPAPKRRSTSWWETRAHRLAPLHWQGGSSVPCGTERCCVSGHHQ